VKILNEGYEQEVRNKLGVTEDDISDEELQSKFIFSPAEAKIIKRVPLYEQITDEDELLSLELAVILQMSMDLCVTMTNRVNTEESTLDIKWKRARTNWDEVYNRLAGELEEALSLITSVEVLTFYEYSIIEKISFPRDPMGGAG
jgi:hypothetical protein